MPGLEAKHSPSMYRRKTVYIGGSVLSAVSGIQGGVLGHIPTGLGGDYGTV